MTETVGSRIEEIGKPWTLEAKLRVPIEGGENIFVFPAFGPGEYMYVTKQVLNNGQKLPTGEQTAIMLNEIYNYENYLVANSMRAEFVRKKIMKKRFLWIPHVNIWTPSNHRNPGMYSVHDEKGEGLTRTYTEEELEERLRGGEEEKCVRFSQDRTVAFAPLRGIRYNHQIVNGLTIDCAHIATYGINGAEMLKKIAKECSTLNFHTMHTVDQWKQSVSCLQIGKEWHSMFNSGDLGEGYIVAISGSENRPQEAKSEK